MLLCNHMHKSHLRKCLSDPHFCIYIPVQLQDIMKITRDTIFYKSKVSNRIKTVPYQLYNRYFPFRYKDWYIKPLILY